MIFCKNCGCELADDALFCTECGQKVNAPEETEQIPAPVFESITEPIEETTNILPDDSPAEVFSEVSAENSLISEFPETEYISSAESDTSFSDETTSDNYTALDDASVPSADLFSETGTFSDSQPIEDYTESPLPVNDTSASSSSAFNEAATPYTETNTAEPTINNTEAAYYSTSADNFKQNDSIAQENAQPVTQEEKKPVKVGAGRIFGASLVALFAMVFTLILSIVLCIKFGANGNVLSKRIEKLDSHTVLSAEFDGDEIANDIYKTVGFGTATNNKADEAGFKKFLTNADFLSYLGGQIKNYADYIIDGKGSDPSITAEDFTNDFFRENRDLAESSFGSPLPEKGLDFIQNNLEKENFDENMSVAEWSRNADFSIKSLSYIFSYITIGITAALVIVLFIWIAVIVDKRGRHLTGFYGNIFLVSGFVMFITGLALSLGASVLYAFTGSVVFYLTANVLLPFALISLGTGFVEFLIGFILKKAKKSIKKKEKTAKA